MTRSAESRARETKRAWRRPYSPALADGKPTAVDEMAALAAEEAARGGMCPLPDL